MPAHAGRDARDMTTYTAVRSRWLTAAVPVTAVAWGTNQFIPMLIVYRGALGLSAAVVQAVFGLYAAGLVPGLLTGGPLSDRYGRRRLMLAALLMSAAASALLLDADGVPLLFTGRLLTGVAAGIAFSTGAAWLRELSADPAVPTAPNPGPRRATVAMCVGFSGGPLAAGLLAAFAPAPTITPYVPHLALVLAGLVLTARAPRGAATTPPRLALGMPSAQVGRFVRVVVPVALWVFTTATVAMAYLPVLVAAAGHGTVLGAAATGGLTAAAGIAVQPLIRRTGRRGTLLALALGLTTAGFALAAAVAATGGLALLLLTAVVFGAAYGALQVWGLDEVQRLAPPERLAGVTAVYQAVTYLGFAAPYLLTLAAGAVRPPLLMLALAAAAAACAVLLRRELRA